MPKKDSLDTANKGRTAHKRLIQDGAKGVEIHQRGRLFSACLALDLFGRHVRRAAEEMACLG